MNPTRPRALVLRTLGLGDYLAGVPALGALRRALPGWEITLAAPGELAPLVRLTAAVDTHLPTGELVPVPWTGPPPRLAVDLHGNGPASRRLLESLRPGRLVGFAGPDLPASAGPPWRDDEPERQRWCRLVETALGVRGDPDDVAIASPDVASPAPGCVVVHPGAAYAARRWPAQRFAAVTRALAREHDVVITGTPGERELAAGVAAAAGLPDGAVLAGTTDLAELAALVADARLVVSGDTGVAHLATSYRTPSVVLFGPTPPALWGPPPQRREHIAIWHGHGRGDPWADRPDPALLDIGVGEVVTAATDLLRRRTGSRLAWRRADPDPSSRMVRAGSRDRRGPAGSLAWNGCEAPRS